MSVTSLSLHNDSHKQGACTLLSHCAAFSTHSIYMSLLLLILIRHNQKQQAHLHLVFHFN